MSFLRSKKAESDAWHASSSSLRCGSSMRSSVLRKQYATALRTSLARRIASIHCRSAAAKRRVSSCMPSEISGASNTMSRYDQRCCTSSQRVTVCCTESSLLFHAVSGSVSTPPSAICDASIASRPACASSSCTISLFDASLSSEIGPRFLYGANVRSTPSHSACRLLSCASISSSVAAAQPASCGFASMARTSASDARSPRPLLAINSWVRRELVPSASASVSADSTPMALPCTLSFLSVRLVSSALATILHDEPSSLPLTSSDVSAREQHSSALAAAEPSWPSFLPGSMTAGVLSSAVSRSTSASPRSPSTAATPWSAVGHLLMIEAASTASPMASPKKSSELNSSAAAVEMRSRSSRSSSVARGFAAGSTRISAAHDSEPMRVCSSAFICRHMSATSLRRLETTCSSVSVI